MIKANMNAMDPRRPGRPAPGGRAGSPSRLGRARRGRPGRPASSLAAMSERHVAALVREVEMSQCEDMRPASGMSLDDSLLDPAFDEEHGGWDAHGCGQYRPRPTWMAAHFRLDGEGSD